MICRFILPLLLLFSTINATEVVLFTQPKTATHLLIPILKRLIGKDIFWPKDYFNEAIEIPLSFEDAQDDPNYIFFTHSKSPWQRQTMDKIWKMRENKILHLHAPYTHTLEHYLAENNCINFFIARDPRDVIVSLLNHYKYIHYNEPEVEFMENDDARLEFLIKTHIRKNTLYYMGWLKSPVCCVLQFDKLMGAHGGAATDEEALGQMKKIAEALNLNFPDTHLWSTYKKAFGRGWGYYKGLVGVWKNHFTEKHKMLVKEEIGDLLIELGYETNLNW